MMKNEDTASFCYSQVTIFSNGGHLLYAVRAVKEYQNRQSPDGDLFVRPGECDILFTDIVTCHDSAGLYSLFAGI